MKQSRFPDADDPRLTSESTPRRGIGPRHKGIRGCQCCQFVQERRLWLRNGQKLNRDFAHRLTTSCSRRFASMKNLQAHARYSNFP